MTEGWTPEEEAAFAQLMAAGGLERIEAMRLYRRFKCDLKRALKYAKGSLDSPAPEPRASRRASSEFPS